MTTTIRTALLALVLASAAACFKSETDEAPPPQPTEPAAPTGSKSPPAPKLAPIADEDLPVDVDFEEQAERDITTDNYKSELDTLENEITASESP